MEHKEEEVLRGTLLPSDLEVAVLEPLEVKAGEPGEEVEAELHGLDFLDDQLDYLQRVALLVDLLDDEGLLDQDGVDELDQLVLEREAFLPELALEDACVVDVEGLLALEAFVSHVCVSLLVSSFLVALAGLGTAALLLYLAEAQHLDQQLDEQALDVPARDHGVGQLRRVLVHLEVRSVGPHDEAYLKVEHDDEGAQPGELDLLGRLGRHDELQDLDSLEGFQDLDRRHLPSSCTTAGGAGQVLDLLEERLFEHVEAFAQVVLQLVGLARLLQLPR